MKKKKALGRVSKRHRRISGVTERKTRQEATPRQADLLQKTLDSMTDAVFVLDAKLPVPTILECNQAASIIFGYDKGEMLGKTSAFLHASDETLREFQSLLYGAVKDGRLPFHLPEFRMKRRDGSVFPSEHSVSQLVNERGDRIAWVSIVRDITEPKRMEEALRRRAEELAALQATVLEITGRQDLPTLLQAVVERAARLLDAHGGGMYVCDPEQKEARCVVSYNTPRDFTGTVLKYGEGAAGTVAETGEPLIVDDYRTWQGRASVFEKEAPFSAVLAVPMMWQGRMIGVIDVLEDVKSRRFTQADLELLTMFANHAAIAVERKRAEEETRLERDRAQTYLDAAGVMIVALDTEGRVALLNRKGCEILGCSQEEALGKNWVDNFLPAAVRDQVQDVFRSLMAGKIEFVKYFENPILTGRAEERLIAWHNTVLKDAEGRVTGILSSGNDITERKRMEEEIRRLNQFRETIIDNANVWLDVLDEKANVVIWNKAAEAMSGYSREEVLGHGRIWEWLYPDEEYRNEITAKVRSIMEKEEVVEDFETRITRKDGQTRIISWHSRSLLDEKGNPVGSIALGRDVTERRRMEEELRRYSEQLERLVEESTRELRKSERLAAIGELAAMVGHDLRNPLTGITAAAYYLKTKWGSRFNPKANEMLKLIERDVEYSNKIIEDLLEYSREIRLDLIESTPRSITEDALGLVKTPRNVTILNLTAVTPRMTVDVEKVKRAFLNIIKNAFDAMPQGGKLTITSGEANGNVKVEFADTGTGMSKSTMEKLWSGPFTTKAKGIGLGLPISKRIIEAHGGSISVESETGRGTSLTVTLPIKASPAGEVE